MEKRGEFKFIIERRDDDDTRWKVVPDESNPAGLPIPGSGVHWEFDENEYYVGLEAHFQFCNSVKEQSQDVCFIASEQINQDWAASIPDHMGSRFLTGTLRPGTPPKSSLFFAVWIVDPQGINDFAIGENPPPKIDTGPR